MGRRAQSVQAFCGADTAALDPVYVFIMKPIQGNEMTLRFGTDARNLDGCNIALMSYAGSSTLGVGSNGTSGLNELSRVGATSWTLVVEALNALLKDCSFELNVGGAAIVSSGEPSSPESMI